MGNAARTLPPATLDDLLAKPADERWEIIDGDLVQQTMTRPDHGSSVLGLGSAVRNFYGHRRRPGGWWFMTDVTIEVVPSQVYRPDILGFRRERVTIRPTEFPIRIRPDWICEVVSPSNPENDLVKKLNHYHRYGVPHYWILDPRDQILTVLRWSEPGYITVKTGLRGEKLRAEPFEEVELDMDDIFDDGTVAPVQG